MIPGNRMSIMGNAEFQRYLYETNPFIIKSDSKSATFAKRPTGSGNRTGRNAAGSN